MQKVKCSIIDKRYVISRELTKSYQANNKTIIILMFYLELYSLVLFLLSFLS